MATKLTVAEQVDLIIGSVDLMMDQTLTVDQRQQHGDNLCYLVMHGTADFDPRAVLITAMLRFNALMTKTVPDAEDITDPWAHAPLVDRLDDDQREVDEGRRMRGLPRINHDALSQLHDDAEQCANGPWCPTHGRVGVTVDGRCGRCFGIEGRQA